VSEAARRENLRRLLRPRHIAMVGGRAIENAIGHARAIGFAGDIWPVHPTRESVAGLRCYPDVASLPQAPDAAFLATPAAVTVEVVDALSQKGAGGAVCFASGFAETGADGAALERKLAEAAGDMAMLGPNCTGFSNYLDRVAVSLGSLEPLPGLDRGPAFVAQSGSIGLNASRARRSLDFAYVMSIGNQAVTDMADLIAVLAEDKRVTAIALYIESLKRPGAFLEAVNAARAAGKPVFVLKAGRHALSARMAQSHTAAMLADDNLYDALFARAGAVRVPTLSVLIETLKLISIGGAPRGRRLAVLTCSGAESTLAADAALDAGFELPTPGAKASAAITELLPAFGTPNNPLDYHTQMWGDVTAQVKVFEALLADGYDSATLVMNFPVVANPDATPAYNDWRAAVEAALQANTGGTPFSVTFSLPEGVPDEERERLAKAGITPLQGFDDAFLALGAARDGLASLGRPAATALAVSSNPQGGRRTCDEWESKQWLSSLGVALPPGRCVAPEKAGRAAGEIGFPVALKAVSAALPHKSEAGAVVLGLESAAAVEHATAAMIARLRAAAVPVTAERMLVEAMAARPVAELIVGITRDPHFGPVLAIGAGGVLAELLGDVATLLLPASRQEIAGALDSLKVMALLRGFRGGPAGDIEAVVDTVSAIADAASATPELLELDVNPLFVLPAGQGAVAVDALMVLAQEYPHPGGSSR
jgi:acetate---CoA ligase (ADP-forming)